VAYFGPFSYVLAKSRAPEIEPFAVGVEKGKPSYNSILIAHAAGPVKTIADVKSKPFAFGDQASTSGHLIPRAHLMKLGLEGDKDYKVVHLGTHDGVARAVQAGQVPAGALSESIFRALVARNMIDPSKVIQLAISEPIPNYPIVMQGNLTPALKQSIRSAFIDMKDKEVLKAFRVESFSPTDDRAYDVLRDTARVLGLELARMK
jgi:phosphonate transport system substrate-binding protein